MGIIRLLTVLFCGLLAQAGLQAKETVGEATAFAINQIVDVATQDYVNSAKTPQERSQFQNAINFFKNSSLSVFGLLGMGHFVKPGPVGKTYSTALRKSLERKVTVKDGIVYAGEKSLGNIKDMPTIRTFKKPTGSASREEFQSDVFTKEVMYQGPGTRYNYRVYQRNDIDPKYIVKTGEKAGLSNLDLMRQGLAAYTNDGKPVILHHIGQNSFGPFAEVTRSSHKTSLHRLYGRNSPHPQNPVIRKEFESVRSNYWRDYAKTIK